MIVSTMFECPNNIEIGVNTLYVVANGISSAGTPVIVE